MQCAQLAPVSVKHGATKPDGDVEMQRFAFRLEAVRRLRLQEEQAVQGELARVMGERNVVLAEIDVSRRAEQDLYEYLRQPGRTAAEMAHVARFGTLHRQQLYNLGIRIRQYDKGIELVRTRLTVARQKREALDKLRDKQHAEWKAEFLREEQIELDEVATMRSLRDRAAAQVDATGKVPA
ncbi:MAG: hypothetical protein JWM90_1464 [Thermoleophilia bacterium]|nr:hypothetical protein [Thermoleophilia bacterium]